MNVAKGRRTIESQNVEARLKEWSREFHDDADGFRDLAESIPVPLALLRLSDHRILFTNGCLDKTFGVARGRLWKRDWSRLFRRLADRRRLAKLAAATDGIRDEHVEGNRDDGRLLWLSVWQRRVVYKRRECLLTVLIDITAQKAAELQEQEDERTVRALLELSDRDRELIAYEIHDGLLQEMVTAIMHLDACRRLVKQGSRRALEEVDRARKCLRQAVKETRRLIDGVRMPDLASAGLIGALRILVQRVSAYSSVHVELVSDMAFPQLAPDCEAAIYRIVQEGLNNVCRHSKSDKARVELKALRDQVKIVIRDWGVGFDPEDVGQGHFGLMGMRHRAGLFGGTVQVKSRPDRGTSIVVTMATDL